MRGGGLECCARMEQRLQAQFEERFVALEANTLQREIKHAEDVSDPKELISLKDEQLIAANHELELRDDTFKTLTGVVEEINRKLT